MLSVPIDISSELSQSAEDLKVLRRMAWACVVLQLSACGCYIFCNQLYPYSHTLSVSCGYLAICISIFPVFYLIYRKRFPLVFSCISIYNLAPIWFLYLETVIPGYDANEYSSPSLVMESLIWVAVFQISVNLLYVWMGNRLSLFGKHTLSFLDHTRLSTNFYITLSAFSFFLPLIAFYYYYDSADILWKALTAGRSGGGSAGSLLIQDAAGGSSSLMLPLTYIWQLTPLFAAIALAQSRRITLPSFFVLLLGGLVIFSFFLGGSRGNMMFVVAPVVFYLIYYNWDKGLKFWIPLGLLLVLSIGIMELQERYRGNLLDVLANPSKAAKENDYTSATTFNIAASHRDNNMYLLCLIVNGYPKKYSFEGFNDVYAIIVNPIPRAFWSGKPVRKEAQELASPYGFISDGPVLITTTSLSYSVVGEAYKAAGLIGIVAYSMIYVLFLAFFDGVLFYVRKSHALSVGVLGMALFLAFWGFRSLYALITFSYPLLLFLIMIRLLQRRRGQ